MMEYGRWDRDDRQMTQNVQKREKRGRKKSALKRMTAMVLGAAVLGSAAAGAFHGTDYLLTALETGGSQESLLAETGKGTVQEAEKNASLMNLQVNDQGGMINTAVSGGLDVSDIAEEALPSVVAITNISVQQVRRYYGMFGRFGQWATELEETESCGSGVIIAETNTDLYIVTNNHVVNGAVSLSVSFVDDAVYNATLCGTDADQDLAVIKVSLADLSDTTRSQIKVASVGSSDALRVGQQVVAIGNAMGYGQSVTTGIVSALNRTVTTGKDSSGNPVTSTYIQTDAAINPGNSGGALLNMDGQLIGINTAKVSSTEIEGMGYAIPISQAWGTIQQLMGQTAAGSSV